MAYASKPWLRRLKCHYEHGFNSFCNPTSHHLIHCDGFAVDLLQTKNEKEHKKIQHQQRVADHIPRVLHRVLDRWLLKLLSRNSHYPKRMDRIHLRYDRTLCMSYLYSNRLYYAMVHQY